MHGVAPYPLYWPLERPRCRVRRKAQFKVDFDTARASLLRELDLLEAKDVLFSSNIPVRPDGLLRVLDKEPDDPGVAVYFTRTIDGQPRPLVFACDQFTQVRWNVRAVQATIEAMRAIERYGAASMMEQAMTGFLLPPAPTARPWREVLGAPEGAVSELWLRDRLAALTLQHHPDRGGSAAVMAAITEAYHSGLREAQGAA